MARRRRGSGAAEAMKFSRASSCAFAKPASNQCQIRANFKILRFKLNSPRRAAVCFKACLAAEKSAALAALASAEKSALTASRLIVLLLCLIEAIYASGVGARAFVGGLALALIGRVVK